MYLSRFLQASLFCLLFSGAVKAQYNISGTVRNGDGKTPLQGVSVSFNSKVVTSTDANGSFTFDAPDSVVVLSFSYVGFQTINSSFNNDMAKDILLYNNVVDLEEAVVKAYESNTAIKDVPATVTVLSKASLQRYGDASILPAVNTVPGVKMDERSPGSYRLSIRGNLLRSPFGVRNVKVYWNGIPFTDANGNTYLNQLGFTNLGRMEIIKGPGGSMYGAGTGGVVLLSSQLAETNEHSISLSSLGGSYGLFETNAAYRKQDEKQNTTLLYSHQQSDGWRDQTATRKDVANYTGTYNITGKHSISANIFYSDLYYQTPGGLTQAQLNANPRQSRPAGAFSSAKQQQAAIFIKTLYAGFANEYHFNGKWSNTTGIYFSATRFRNPSILNYQRKTEQGIGGRSVTQYHNNRFTLHIGGEYQYGFTSTQTYANKFGVPDTMQYNDEIAALQYNLFAQADVKLAEGLDINAGLSYNNYRYGFTRLNLFPVTEVKKPFDPVVVPRISLIKKWSERFITYAAYSKGYSPPTIDEVVPSNGVFNKDLAAEKASNYEVGIRTEPLKNVLFVDIAAYYFNLDNTLVTRRDAAGSDYFVNTGKTNQKGLEATASYYPVHNATGFLQDVKIWANYTYIHARFDTYKQGTGDFSGNKLTGTPPNVFVAGADVQTKPGLYASLTYSYTDMIPLNDANTFFGTQYNLFFARTGYKKDFGKTLQVEIYVSYDKSFNNPYGLGNDLNAAGNRFFNPSAPENFIAGIKLKARLK